MADSAVALAMLVHFTTLLHQAARVRYDIMDFVWCVSFGENDQPNLEYKGSDLELVIRQAGDAYLKWLKQAQSKAGAD